MFAYLEHFVTSFSLLVPLPFFAFFATGLEELIPPIPSPSIMIIAGSFALAQHYSIWGMVALCLLGITGKTLGAWLVYFIFDKFENILSSKFGKFIGVKPGDIEAFGARLGHGVKDYFLLIFLRAVPVFPSTILTVGGGLLKIPLKLFLVSTIVGSMFRSTLYFYMGYVGTSVTASIVKNTNNIESTIQIIIVLLLVIFLGYLYYKRRKANLL
jgi:membrane protein DedA with SNARE-associated domain